MKLKDLELAIEKFKENFKYSNPEEMDIVLQEWFGKYDLVAIVGEDMFSTIKQDFTLEE